MSCDDDHLLTSHLPLHTQCGGNIAVYLAFGLVVLNWASILSDASKAFVRTFIGVEAAYAAFNVFLLLMCTLPAVLSK